MTVYDGPQKLDVHEYVRHSTHVFFADNTLRLKPDYVRNGELRPTNLAVSWTWKSEEGAWSLESVTVSGPIIKKDGTDGRSRGKVSFTPGFNGVLKNDTPSWVVSLVEAHTPTTIDTGR